MANIVYFDLESTGLLKTNPDITQIGAITSNCEESFDKYLIPNKSIPRDVEELTGIKWDEETQKMYKIINIKHKVKVDAVDAKTGLLSFIIWLRKVSEDIGNGTKVVLVAYNAFRFDAKLLLQKIEENSLGSLFNAIVKGFIDPYVAVCELHPSLTSKSQENVLKYLKIYSDFKTQSHNALQDANDLRRLCKKLHSDYNKTHSKLDFGTVWFLRLKLAQKSQPLFLLIVS